MREMKRWSAGVLLLAAACGGDGGGGEDTFVFSAVVRSVDDDAPLAGVRTRSVSGAAVVSDASGRVTLPKVRAGSVVKLEHDTHAPIAKPGYGRGEVTMKMKNYDGVQAVTSALGGEVRSTRDARGAARVAAGALVGAASAELVIATPDPRRADAMRAITGDFTAQREGRTGRLSVVSPVFVSTRVASPARLNPGAKVELDFPAWLPSVSTANLALFSYDDATAKWDAIGTVTATQAQDGQGVLRAAADRLGWFAVGELIEELACVHACAVDAANNPFGNVEVAATGVDHFSQTLGALNNDGCVELQVRPNAQLRVEVRSPNGTLLQKTVSTGAPNLACVDAGVLGATMSFADAGGFAEADAGGFRQADAGYRPPDTSTRLSAADRKFLARYVECGLPSPESVELELGLEERSGLHEGADSVARWARKVDCIVALSCPEVVGLICNVSSPGIDACEELPDGYTFVCTSDPTEYGDVCDGSRDCTDGSDETSETCRANYSYKCESVEQYVSYNDRCNGETDCPGGDDERGCFVCGDGASVRPDEKCDGYTDCDDGTDEVGCPVYANPCGGSADSTRVVPSVRQERAR